MIASSVRILTSAFVLMPAIPAVACTYPPPPLKCSQNFVGDAEGSDACAAKALAEHIANWRRAKESSSFQTAETIYFGRIVRSEEITVAGSPYGRQIQVKPYVAIGGNAPVGLQVLKDRELTSCGMNGDGWATSGNVSDIVVVFEGVAPSGINEFSTTFSMLVEDIQYPELDAAWEAWINGDSLKQGAVVETSE